LLERRVIVLAAPPSTANEYSPTADLRFVVPSMTGMVAPS
jgi:hypothetical protein